MTTTPSPQFQRTHVKSIEFGLFGPDEINRLAVCRVTEPTMYAQNLPVANGCMDHRMGSVDRRLACGTCRRSVHDCPGHFGVIQLGYPVYHQGYIDLVLKILKCVCYYCSALLVNDVGVEQLRAMTSQSKDPKKRLKIALAFSKKRVCPSCGGCNPTYSKQGLAIRTDFSKVTFDDPAEAAYCSTRPFSSADARTILRCIPDSDVALLGFNPEKTRPELFLISSLAVCPPIVRPSVVISEGSKARGQDDLTSKLCDIIKSSSTLKSVLAKEASSIPGVGLSVAAQQAVADVMFHVATLMCNDIRGERHSYQRSGLPSKSVTSRLKGKEGRIRGSLMGKRVDFSSRSVISPDPQMDVDQVGVPEKVAVILTVPERVTDRNIQTLRARVRVGPGRLSGAHSVQRSGGSATVLLEYADLDREVSALKVGDIVERPLQDGDIVLFNRQPSLHKGSFMGFRVKVMSQSTFRINLACTPSLNADCDGDEMNIHVPQNAEAQTEARLIMSVPNQIVSPQSNKPCIGLVQDALLGASLLSRDSTRITRRKMVELASVLKTPRQPFGAPAHEDGTYSGRQAFSMLLPPDLDYENHKVSPPVVVAGGRLVGGRLCKQSLGTSFGGLVHRLWLQYGPHVCAQFLSDSQRLVNRWLTWHGFSVRLSDCLPAPGVTEQVQNVVRQAEDKVRQIESDPNIRRFVPGDMETACSAITNRTLTKVGKIVHASLDEETNALYQTVGAGSKGNLINVAQLIGIVGQQSLEGKRIDGEKNGFVQVPLTEPSSVVRKKGFVKSSYVSGLDPAEFFFHSMAGREGLVDTAVKTATTGYLQRRLMKAMEMLGVAYDGTVRNARDHIVQFVYGADGFDASFLVRHSLRWHLPDGELTAPQEREAYLKLSRAVRRSRLRPVPGDDVSATAYSPCRVKEARCEAERWRMHAQAESEPEVGALEAYAQVERLCADVCVCWWGRRSCLELHLRWELRSHITRRCTAAELQKIVHRVRQQVQKALVAAGEMVGAIAAQSIGEPTSQSTLNTFHHAGVAAKNVTLGVPRIKELIDCTRHIKTPTMQLVAAPRFGQVAAEWLPRALVHLTLGQATATLSILHEPEYFASAQSPIDHYLCAREAILAPEAPADMCPYVARFVLDPVPLVERDMGPAQAAEAVAAHFAPGAVQILHSEESMDTWVLRIRPLGLAMPVAKGSSAAAATEAERLAFFKGATEEMATKASKDCVIGGVVGVGGATLLSHKTICAMSPQGHFEAVKVPVVATEGSNLRAALGIPELQSDLCTSNDVSDVLSVLGVEAAAALLFQELTNTLQFDGGYINERHVMLLVNLMTSLGQLLPISRHGLNRLVLTSGPLAKCSFEETVDVLYDAAAYGECDPVRGVTESVMLGQRAFIGTGVCAALGIVPKTSGAQAAAPSSSIAEEEEVIFTTVDSEVALMTTTTSQVDASRTPVEMPFDVSDAAAARGGDVMMVQPAGGSLLAGAQVPIGNLLGAFTLSARQSGGSGTRGAAATTASAPPRRYTPSSPRMTPHHAPESPDHKRPRL